MAKRCANVVPNQPVRVQFDCAVSPVEKAGGGVGRIHVHANPHRLLFHKPLRQQEQQTETNPAPAFLQNDVDPLQFSLAIKAAREMSGDESGEGSVFPGCINNPGNQCLLWMKFAVQVACDADVPVFLRFPLRRPDSRHGGDVRSLCLPVLHHGPGGYFFFAFNAFATLLFFVATAFVIVLPLTNCLRSFTLARELAWASFISFLM